MLKLNECLGLGKPRSKNTYHSTDYPITGMNEELLVWTCDWFCGVFLMSLDHCCLSGGHGTFQIMPDPIQFGYFTILYQVWHWKHVLRMQCRVTVYAPLGRQSPTKNQVRSVVVRPNLHIADWKKTYPFTSPESFQKNCIWIVEAFQILMFFLQITDFCFFFETWTWIPGSPISFRDVFQRCSGKASHCGNGVRNCMWRQQKPNTCRMTSNRGVAGGFFRLIQGFWGEVFFILIFWTFEILGFDSESRCFF